jgi:hypothetical protein
VGGILRSGARAVTGLHVDQHVYPADQEHEAAPSCWCQPVVDWMDPLSGGRVWVHRRANDLPLERPHPDAGDPAANHYDWFMPADPGAAVDGYLDDFEAKMRQALMDPFVHDMAQSVLPLIAAYRQAVAAERERIRLAVEALAGPLCVCPADDGLPVCTTHSELCFDGRCEDFPTWLPPVVAIVEGREP